MNDILYLMLKNSWQAFTIKMLCERLEMEWKDAARAVTILQNRYLIYAAEERGKFDMVPSFKLTSAGQMEAERLQVEMRLRGEK